jgi:hypothetical protein
MEVTMFGSPPESVHRLKASMYLIALIPALLGGGIAALAYFDPTTTMGTGWVIGLSVVGAFSVFLWIYFSREEISIHPEGIAKTGIFGAKEIRWENVKELRYSQTTTAQAVGAQLGLLGALLAAFMNKRKNAGVSTRLLKVVSSDGTKINLNNYFHQGKEAMHRVFSRVNPPMLSDMRSQLKQGAPLPFGKLVLSLQGISCKNKPPIAFQEVESSRIEGSNLVIRARGKRLSYASLNAGKVPNLFVALDLIEEMKNGSAINAPERMSFAAAV